MYGLENKIAIVTGGSRGIGFATAKELKACGCKVIIIHCNKKVKNSSFDKEIIADISDEKQVKKAIDLIVAEFGKIDILVNNAGIAIDKDFNKRTVKDWEKTLGVNLIGTWLVSKYVGQIMMKHKDGKIVIISSTSGLLDFNTTSIDYDSSKVGLISLTKNLAIEFSPFINVNAICPGWVDTDINKDLPKDYVMSETKKILKGRWAKPSEIAKPVRFLCTDDASYINGEYIIINGGRY